MEVLGIICALLGLLVGAFFAFFSLLDAAVGMANSQGSGTFIGLFLGVGSLIFWPIFYGVVGGVLGVIPALIYDGVAYLIGGIEIELEEVPRSSSAPGSTFSP